MPSDPAVAPSRHAAIACERLNVHAMATSFPEICHFPDLENTVDWEISKHVFLFKAIFLNRKSMVLENRMTAERMLTLLREGQLRFPPLDLELTQVPASGPDPGLDAMLKLNWQDRSYRFAIVVKSRWTPKAVTLALVQARQAAASHRLHPLILVPYLSEEWIQTLEAEGVSGLDLCGNGAIVVPGKLLVLRTGFPNRFRWEGTIKNVYRKNSSIVARVFLLVPQFNSAGAILQEIRRRGGDVSAATVSKVCTSLHNDLVIERQRGDSPVARRFRLLQPDKLLDLLARNYAPPTVNRTFRGKAPAPEELDRKLAAWETGPGRTIVLTGACSVDAYAVMAREPVRSFWCSDLASLREHLGDAARETERFPNVAFLETRDDFVYFDRRPGLVASPIQTYLELAQGDPRDQETADQVRRLILTPQASPSPGEE